MFENARLKRCCCWWGVWYVKQSALLVLVCNKEKEKRTKKEKEKHHQKKLQFVDCPEVLKERKKSSKRKIENNLVIQQFKYLKLLVY